MGSKSIHPLRSRATTRNGLASCGNCRDDDQGADPGRPQEGGMPAAARGAGAPGVGEEGILHAPKRVKWSAPSRYGSAPDTWIETGAYRGDTTAFLAIEAAHVYSIEPEPTLGKAARERFADDDRVTIAEGPAEDRLPRSGPGSVGPVSFWARRTLLRRGQPQGPGGDPHPRGGVAIEQHLDCLGPVRVPCRRPPVFRPEQPGLLDLPLAQLAGGVDGAQQAQLDDRARHLRCLELRPAPAAHVR